MRGADGTLHQRVRSRVVVMGDKSREANLRAISN